MKKRSVLIISVIVIAGLLLALYGFSRYFSTSLGFSPGSGAGNSSLPTESVVVSATVVTPSTLDEIISAVGSTVSNESVILSPEIAGRISAIHFENGAAAPKGKVLIELDASTQLAELRQAKANLDLARTNDRRTTELAERNFVSKTAADEAKTQLKVAEANLSLAEAKYQKTLIRAPFNGVLGIRTVSVGDYVKEGDPLVNIEDIASLNVDFQVPEAWMSHLKVGLPVIVRSDAFGDRKFTATVRAIDPQIQTSGRSFSLRASLPNGDRLLKPGMFVRITVQLGHREDALMVPESAIVSMGTDRFVYRIVDGKAVRTIVSTGARQAGQVEILEGVSNGDTIVTAGQQKLRDNQAVTVAEPSGRTK